MIAQDDTAAVEIDALGQIEPIDLELVQADDSISLAHILRGGGTEVNTLKNEVGPCELRLRK